MAIIIGDTERADLKAAVARARAHPVPWKQLKHSTITKDATNTRRVEDSHNYPLAEFVTLPFGYLVAVSFEQQPAGMCLHISVSGPWPKVAPNMAVCAMVFTALDLPAEADDLWTEELSLDGNLGRRTVNAVWLVEPAF